MVRLACAPLSAALLVVASSASAAVFVSSVPDKTYVAGTGAGAYTDPSAALGKPAGIVGATSFPSIFSPFSPHYETDQLAGIGLDGSITFGFARPIAVIGGPMIGVLTYTGLTDSDYPNGTAGSPAQTFASQEYNARPSALVEVGSSLSQMQPLGRKVLDLPGNYYTKADSPYEAMPPANPVEASFDKPFTGSLDSFDGESFSQVLQTLDDSVGGTWLTVPASLGLHSISFIRFSDPQWKLADGSYADEATSAYSDDEMSARLLLNAVWAIPEPGTALLLIVPAAVGLLRRRRAR